MNTDLLIAGIMALNLIPVVAFVAYYSRSPWWTSPQGRALMMLGSSHALIFVMAIAGRVFGDYPGRVPVTVTVLFITGAAYWVLLYALRQQQRLDSNHGDRRRGDRRRA